MNQILSTNNGMGEPNKPKKNERKNEGQKTYKSKGPAKITSVILVFVILISIFGIGLIGFSVYRRYINTEGYDITATTPTITQGRAEEQLLTVEVSHDKALEKIEYNWNDEMGESISIDGETEFKIDIEIPEGKNILYFTATDINGQSTNFEQTFEIDEMIKFSVENGDMNISVNSNVEIEYMVYQWNVEESVTVEIGANTIEQLISIPVGLNELTVQIVDVNGIVIEKSQAVEGVLKPEITGALDETQTNIILTMKDEIGLKSIHILMNEEKEYSTSMDGALEYQYSLPIEDLISGQNIIMVTVTNTKGVSIEYPITVNK